MTPLILFVDDEPNIIYAALRNLRSQPFEIVTASDAESAKLTLMTRNVDLIVTDENMPGKSGVELLKWVANKFPDIVRISLTGQSNLDVAVRAVNEAEVYRFLQKPCHPFELAMAIRKGLEARVQSV